MKKKVIVSVVIITQLVIVTFLGFRIWQKSTKVLGQMSVMPISKEYTIKTDSNTLEFFYELQPDTIISDDSRIPMASSYTINKDSLNDRFDYTIEKPQNSYRIITLGDSFTFGGYVPTASNWTEKLEDILLAECSGVKFEVINLGVFGYDIQYSSERYKIRGEKYNPDLIIWLLKDDDFTLVNELYLERARRYHEEMKQDSNYQKEYIEKGKFYPGWEKAAEELLKEHPLDSLYSLSSSYLQGFTDTYRRKLLIASLSSVTNQTRGAISSIVSDRVYKFEIPTDLYKDKELYYENDSHPTVKGHEVIANDIHSYLSSNSFFHCN